MSIKFKNLTDLDKAYIAGFFDGDGSIVVQIVKDNTRVYKHYVRISLVFYQKSKHHWFIIWLSKVFAPYGYITKRSSGMSEFTIVAKTPVKEVLNILHPYLKIKKPLCNLVLNIITDLETIQTEADFLKVCQKVDKVAEYTYSKTRTITSETVALNLKLPVETSF